jgi:hypothetical protein
MGNVSLEATFIDLAKVLGTARRVKRIHRGQKVATSCVE